MTPIGFLNSTCSPHKLPQRVKGRSQAIDKLCFHFWLLVLRICISQKGINCSPSNANHLLGKVRLQQPKGRQPLKDKASSTLSPSPEGFYSTLRMGVLADTALEKRWSRRNSFEFGFSQRVQENGALGNKSTPAISSTPPTPTLTETRSGLQCCC